MSPALIPGTLAEMDRWANLGMAPDPRVTQIPPSNLMGSRGSIGGAHALMQSGVDDCLDGCMHSENPDQPSREFDAARILIGHVSGC